MGCDHGTHAGRISSDRSDQNPIVLVYQHNSDDKIEQAVGDAKIKQIESGGSMPLSLTPDNLRTSGLHNQGYYTVNCDNLGSSDLYDQGYHNMSCDNIGTTGLCDQL